MMKKNIFFLFLFFGSFSLNAQDYHPLLVEGYYWDVYHHEMGDFAQYPNSCMGGYRYYIDEDIIANGYNYKIIKSLTLTPVNVLGPPFIVSTSGNPAFLMREDIQQKTIYTAIYNDNNIIEEQLSYDFNLQIGDSSDSNYLGIGITFTVYNIEDYIHPDGNTVKKYIFLRNDNTIPLPYDYYIEGVGGGGGLAYPLGPFFEDYDWLANYNLLKSNELNISENIDVYPIPFKDSLNIDFGNGYEDYLMVELYNTLGQCLMAIEVNTKEIEFQTDKLHSGIYILKISTDSGQLISKKMLKQ